MICSKLVRGKFPFITSITRRHISDYDFFLYKKLIIVPFIAIAEL